MFISNVVPAAARDAATQGFYDPCLVALFLAVLASALAAIFWRIYHVARRNEARLKFLVDALGDTIVFFDAKDRVALFNETARNLYASIGITLRRGMPYREILTQAAAGGHYPEAANDPVRWEEAALERFRHARNDIERRGEHYEQLIQVKMPGGETLRRHSDVTRLVRHAAELELSRTQLAESARRSEAANAAKTEFLARMSHALRTPLNAIAGAAWLLADDVGAAGRMHVDTILKSSRHLVGLADELADFSGLESGGLEIKPVATNLADCLEHPILVARGLAPHGVSVEAELAADAPPRVMVDGRRVEQVLLHLLEHAVARAGTGLVRLSASAGEAGHVRFRIESPGDVADREEFELLFETFSHAAARLGGSGADMSLALSARLVTLLGGVILVSFPGDARTLITIDLPAEIVADEISSAPERQGPLAPLDILVADDVKSARQLLKMLLERDGHRVVVAEDGAQAVAAARRQSFDVILLDLEMPELDGFEAARAIRAISSPRAGRIYACTAQVFDIARQKALDAGMDDFLPKPVNPAHLRVLLSPGADASSRSSLSAT